MAYTDTTQVKNYLQRDLTDYEIGTLVLLIPAIKKWIDQKTGSTFDEATSSTRYYDGGGTSVDIDPCTAVTAVSTLDNDGSTSQEYVTLQDYVLEPQNETVKREVVRRSGCFPRGQRRVAVTAKFSEYDEGVPEDIQMVATRLAATLLKQSSDLNTGAVQSESLEGHSVHYATSSTNIDEAAKADPFVRSVIEQHTEIPVA